ncbi:hypothetical protein CspHIS471_0306340 [Cutaneotrichosporon sp. HIS471]|nr:hypothetical protein CspHIS471_0306340 [Cutaneotrichosporon sp. HIS471]
MKDHFKSADDVRIPHPDNVPIPTDRVMMDARKINPMDAAHVMDFGNLALGHPTASHKNVWLVDLAANVYGLEEIKGSNRPISVVMLAHGWANKAKQMEAMASGLVGESLRLAREGDREVTHDMLVVTLDQRNHGDRRRNPDGLSTYRHPMRPADMLTVVTGGVHDYQLVMDFLGSYLFPLDERVITRWMASGVSMGGHLAWRLLRDDPRVRVGVPIVSIPPEKLGTLLTIASEREGTLGTAAKPYPASLRRVYERATPPGAYMGKKILCLYGEVDAMVPYALGAEALKGIMEEYPGDVQFWIQEERGHVCTPEMVQRAALWFWRWGTSA